jgi:arylsulfatase A-like enzyme
MIKLLLLLLVPFGLLAQEKQVEKPNVLFILADDFGYHDMSCMGSKFYETPNIDKIAEEGVIFSNGYAACGVCSPSRASIMTGKFTARHGITDWIGAYSGKDWRKMKKHTKMLPANYTHALPSQFVTLPEALKEGGYKTFFAGKWHLGKKGSWPQDHGFDSNKGGYHAGHPGSGYFSPFNNPNLTDGQDGENLSMRLAHETVKFFKENNPKETGHPVFAFLSFYAVHAPIQTTQQKWNKYRKKAQAIGVQSKAFKMDNSVPARQVQDNPVYAGLVETMDDAVGEVLNALYDLGLDDNTIVIFTSDNGGVSSGEAFSTSNLPLKGGKGSQFEGGIREPFFIKVPWLNNQQVCTTPVMGTDFYPTILELAGLSLRPKEHNDGLSLVPLLKGKNIQERPLVWHYPHYSNQGGKPSSAIRMGKWKLIHYYEDEHEELFNLDDDIQEVNNLAKAYPEMTNQLSEKLFGYLNNVGAKYPDKDSEYNESLERKHLENVKNNLLPRLEKQRLKYLSEDFNPENNWWGSSTKD